MAPPSGDYHLPSLSAVRPLPPLVVNRLWFIKGPESLKESFELQKVSNVAESCGASWGLLFGLFGRFQVKLIIFCMINVMCEYFHMHVNDTLK